MRTNIFVLLFSALLFSMSCFAVDSTRVRQHKVAAMNRAVVLTNCITTPKEEYIVTVTNYTPAYPACPPNMVVKKINLETERSFLEVITKVSVECCQQKVGWQATAA